MQEVQSEQAEKDGKLYYDNDLVAAKPDGVPIAASRVSSQFGKLLERKKEVLDAYHRMSDKLTRQRKPD